MKAHKSNRTNSLCMYQSLEVKIQWRASFIKPQLETRTSHNRRGKILPPYMRVTKVNPQELQETWEICNNIILYSQVRAISSDQRWKYKWETLAFYRGLELITPWVNLQNHGMLLQYHKLTSKNNKIMEEIQ